MASKKSGKSLSWKSRILLIVFLITAVVFVPTTALLFVGMIPTFVVRLVDNSRERTKVLTIGFMNFAGCFPYWIDLVREGHTLDASVSIITQPMTIVVMYAAAAAGYVIEWGVTGVVSNMMVQRGHKRISDIKDLQERMVKRWGPEVTGDLPLDAQGFPIDNKE